MVARSRSRRLAVVAAALGGLALAASGCGGSGDDDHAPDEATFCRLALANDPVAESDAVVLRRLDRLAPDEVDAAVVVLREASEELEDLAPRSPEAIALEFEIRFRPDYIDAREEVEAFVDAECRLGKDGDDTDIDDELGRVPTP